MSILSQKRQITLPKELCDRLLVKPGDDLSFLEYEGRITIIKKGRGRSDGILSHVKANPKYSEEQALQDVLSRKYAPRSAKKIRS